MSQLPSAPNLEHLRKEAKRRARAEGSKLSEAQLVIAREYGFPSWPRLKAYVERVQAHGPDLMHAYNEDLDYYAERAYGLHASAVDETPAALATLARYGQEATLPGARAAVALSHGFPSWPALRRHVNGLRASGEPFARAYRAVEDQDVDGLRAIVDRFPELVHAQGTNGNDLLGMSTAKHDERLVQVLLDRGADVSHANAHGWTALHQCAYSGTPHLIELLLAAGADPTVSGRGDGGTPLIVALFWGKTAAAELLATASTAPANLRVGAGLGDLSLSTADGAHRGFYRPHSGFGEWRPSDDIQEVLDEALSWAARNGRTNVLAELVRRGARVDADVYRGTAMAWAARLNRADTVRELLRLGADPNNRDTFGGPTHGHGTTPLIHAAEDGRREIVDILLAAGADPALRDELHGGDASGWAEHGGHPKLAAYLRSL